MDKLVIKGPARLKGGVVVSGSKNGCLAVMAACLLVKDKVILKNVPEVADIYSMIKLLESLGVLITFNNHTLTINTKNVTRYVAKYNLVRKMRASALVLGPLAARFKKAKVSLPGGCAIGARPIDIHLKCLEALGCKIKIGNGYAAVSAKELKGAELYMDFPSVGATENIIVAASIIKGETVIQNAAQEPEISFLADFLNKCGAQISDAGKGAVRIKGVKKLKGCEFTVLPDRIEAATYIIAGLITNSNITVKNLNVNHIKNVIDKLIECGAKFKIAKNSVEVLKNQNLVPKDLMTKPYPGFPTDVQAQYMALMAVLPGSCSIKETVFENRFMHAAELVRLGADIKIEGNMAFVKGVEKLTGANVMATDLRASAALVLAALFAEGETLIHRIYHLDRGYEKLEKRLSKLNAKIYRLNEQKELIK